MENKKDIYLLFATRILRMFAYGFLSIIIVLYLRKIGLNDYQAGFLLTLTLIGDVVISFWITTRADKIGRKKMLILSAFLMVGGALVFLLTNNFIVLMFAAFIGVISPGGKEIGPFLSVEQAGLAQLIETGQLTKIFAWYNMAGSFATALGVLCAGWLVEILQHNGFGEVNSYKIVFLGYIIIGIVLSVLFLFVSKKIETFNSGDKKPSGRIPGLHISNKIVLRLSGLFAIDAFAGGLIIQSIIAYWFYLKFKIDIGTLGTIFFAANLLAGVSALLAAKFAKQFGLLNTMVFTHLPSNILLFIVPVMPTLPLAIGVLLFRFSISQMDVPTRQAYTMAVVSPDERSAASGVTTIARSAGAAVSPTLAGVFLANAALLNFPFFIAGGLKIIYDIWIYFSFRKTKVPE